VVLIGGAGFDTPPAVLYVFQLLLADWLMCVSAFLTVKHLEWASMTSSKDEEDYGYDLVDIDEELVPLHPNHNTFDLCECMFERFLRFTIIL
jgi:hypothetical protein